MVKETRIIFDLGDIKAVRIECNSCHGELVLTLDKPEIPVCCPLPHCGKRWAPQGSTSSKSAGVLTALRALLHYPDESMTFRFEIDGEED